MSHTEEQEKILTLGISSNGDPRKTPQMPSMPQRFPAGALPATNLLIRLRSETRMIHISWAGPERKIIDRKYRVWKFEDHRYCGPIVIDRNGDPKDDQPKENSPFWDAVSLWYQQGKQIDKNGFCVWQKPTIQKMKHIGGRNYKLLP